MDVTSIEVPARPYPKVYYTYSNRIVALFYISAMDHNLAAFSLADSNQLLNNRLTAIQITIICLPIRTE